MNMDSDPTTSSLVELAQAIALRKLSAREVALAHLERIDQLDGFVASFVSVDREGALAAADRADAAVARGEKLGPLHGVPLAHKDMFDRAGATVACGSKIRQNYVPTQTATVLKRLDDAGAISLGALAMVEFAMGPHGYNANLRQCRNPWALDHVPCGSSSGSGVAVASHFVAGSLGSDTGGSVRCPASACGVVGLLPTYSRVSRHGAMPMSPSLDSVGPLARTARDCARLMNAIAGRDPLDATSSDAPTQDYEATLETPIKGLRVGVPTNYFGEGVSREVESRLAESLALLRAQGATIVEIPIPSWIENVADLHPLIMKAEGAANHHLWMRAFPERYSTEVRNRLQAGFFIPAVDYIQALKLRGGFLREFVDAVFSKVDVLHTPVLPRAAPTIAETTTADGPSYLAMVVSLTRNTKVVNYLGLPAISVPCGFTASGLPISFQLIGRPFSEALLLRIAHRYQMETDWRLPTPDIENWHSRREEGSATATDQRLRSPPAR
jgi:aspartyl-tRNA(Asn)/glutamyl-tRNA(Gln) amidotransferase subunit A